MPRKTAQVKGFTLIELLLVITLMMIMAGAMIPSFDSYLRSQALKQAQERVKSDIRTVQNKALTGALYDQTINVGAAIRTVTHWGIRFDSGTATYRYLIAYGTTYNELRNECINYATARSGAATAARLQGTASLPTGMVFKSPTGCLFFDFKKGSASRAYTGAVGIGFTSPVYFGYSTSSATGNCRNIKFNGAGNIFNTNNAQCSCANANYTGGTVEANCP